MRRPLLDAPCGGGRAVRMGSLLILTFAAIVSCLEGTITKYEGGCDNKSTKHSHFEKKSICCGKTMFIFNGEQSLGQTQKDYYRCCNNKDQKGEIYKPEEAECCNGSVHYTEKWRDGTWKCCIGQELFNSLENVCCVEERRSGNVYGTYKKLDHHLCCGMQYYNTLTHICCSSSDGMSNAVHQLPHDEAQELVPSRQTACCGTSAYKAGPGHICLDDHIMDLSALCKPGFGPEEYSNDTHFCCSGQVASKAEHTCCQNKLHDLIKGGVCCGQRYVEDSNYICCSGTPNRIVDVEYDFECCGTRTYNVQNQICFHGEIYENRYGSHGTVCRSRNSSQVSIMDKTKHMCCNGIIYLSANYLCCKHTAVLKRGRIGRCCGNAAYDSDTEMCTPSEKVLKYNQEERNSNPEQCRGRRINSQTTICCENRALSRQVGDTCCGSRNYFRSQQKSCCGKRLITGPCTETHS